MIKMREEHAEAHESKLAEMQTAHQKKLQGLRGEQELQLKQREQEHQDHLQYLQQSPARNRRPGPGSEVHAALQAAQRELAQIKV